MIRTLLRPLVALLAALGLTLSLMTPAHATESTNCGWAYGNNGAESRFCVEVRWDRNGVGVDVNRIKLYKDGGKALRAAYDLVVYHDGGEAHWARNDVEWVKVDGEWIAHLWYPGTWVNAPGKVRLQLNVRMGEGDGEPGWVQINIPVWIGQDW